MKRIASFSVNHDKITRGMYISRIDGDVVTYDIRMKLPNNPEDNYLSNGAMHTIEHLFATYARNTEYSENIVYVGPMGCRTGFYFTVWGDHSEEEIANHLMNVLKKVAVWDKPIPATTAEECGNYKDHDLEGAKHYAKQWCDGIEKKGWNAFI